MAFWKVQGDLLWSWKEGEEVEREMFAMSMQCIFAFHLVTFKPLAYAKEK